MLKLNPGIVFGKSLKMLFEDAKENSYALPAINVTTSSTLNSVLEAAKVVNSPVVVQLSHGGAQFFAGKSIDNSNHQASISGAISAAMHIHEVAKLYGVPVVIHTDHAARNLLPWVDGLLEADIKFYKENGYPLFSMHMVDLSIESIKDNVETSKLYLERFQEAEVFLELELGVTGGEEDGVNHTDIENSRLYSQPEDVAFAYEELSQVSENFLIAASFGNVHGVYASGNVKLHPEILHNCQEFLRSKLNIQNPKPLSLVFHGSSGSTQDEIKQALSYGIVKMNIDTDMQWAYWDGVRKFVEENNQYLQGQLGNTEGAESPNKKYYDPRAWLRAAEESMVARTRLAFEELNCINRNSNTGMGEVC
jgi:fructose-bisphosphate aldolase, class II